MAASISVFNSFVKILEERFNVLLSQLCMQRNLRPQPPLIPYQINLPLKSHLALTKNRINVM